MCPIPIKPRPGFKWSPSIFIAIPSFHQKCSVMLLLVIHLKICYHTRVKSEGESGVSRHCPDPPQPTWTSLERIQQLEVYWEDRGKSASIRCHVTSHHFPSTAWRRWVTRQERSARMKRSSYGERDYGFGQAMLTLRSAIGLTQAGLAEFLGISRKAVGGWESGGSYPKAEHLKALLMLAVQQGTFPAGREAEEIRAFWKAAHQKVLLDESWLSALLSQHPRPLEPMVPPSIDVTGDVTSALAAPVSGPRVDWGEALDVPSFYGREGELATLAQWVMQERCRVVSVLGLGGIGKSALVVSLMHQVAAHFEVVLWRSLRDAPSCEALLEECLQVLAPQPLREVPSGLERRLGLLLEFLRQERALVVLDNLETLLEEGEGMGSMRAGYEGYGQLLRRAGEGTRPRCVPLARPGRPARRPPLA